MKKKSIILIVIGIFAFLFAVFIGAVTLYNVNLGPVDKKDEVSREFIVSEGEATSTIISRLKSEDLIRNEMCLKIYVKLHPGTIKAGSYVLLRNMSAKDIYSMMVDGKVTYDTVWVTFVEGKRLNYIENQIADNFGFDVGDVESVIEDVEFIRHLIDKYDVLTEDILNDSIYHPLEGYLFPDTYEFLKDSSIEDIVEKLVATTNQKVMQYSEEIEDSKLSIHEIMTLASMVEMEGTNDEDRPKIAGVFMNRLNNGWPTLGSDVTTYYGVGKDFGQDLTMSDLRNCNPYNTSGYGCRNGLPVGPIASVSVGAIKAAINPSEHDYYYFVSDKNKKIYFSKTDAEHNATIRDLQNKGLWYVYD